MNPERRASAGDTNESALALAYVALNEGETQAARELAQSVLIAARSSSNRHIEAHAWSCLAHCDRVGSRLRRASDASRRAAQLFEKIGDVNGETEALTTLAHVCMLLGRSDDSVEAALLCVRLCDQHTPQLQAVLAHNCLGIAYGWSGSFDRASATLETAIQIAGQCDPRVSTYQPRLNQVWVEAARLADERYRTGAIGSLEKMAGLVRECERLEAAGEGLTLVPGLKLLSRTVWLVMSGLLAAWRGDLGAARADRVRHTLAQWQRHLAGPCGPLGGGRTGLGPAGLGCGRKLLHRDEKPGDRRRARAARMHRPTAAQPGVRGAGQTRGGTARASRVARARAPHGQ